MVDTKMTKSVGEYWVCSALARRGWGAALTRDGLERTDILAVQTDDARRQIEIQVKSANGSGDKTNWRVGEKAQLISKSDSEWFVFVAIDSDPLIAPRSFIMPRDHVAAAAHLIHMRWLTDPTVPAGRRNVGIDQARVSLFDWAGYEDRWDLLLNPTTSAPVLLRPELRELAHLERVGLPVGHPWSENLPFW